MNTSSDPVQACSGSTGDTCGVIRLSNLDSVVAKLGELSFELYLEEFERRLKQVLRSADSYTKIPPNKYRVELYEITESSLVELAVAKLVRELEKPVEIIGDRLRFEFNMGFAIPGLGVSNKATMRAAESSLKSAVRAQKTYVIGGAEGNDKAEIDPHLLPRLEQALETGELVLHYQAKVDAAYQRLVGAEGLVRWNHPEEKRVIPPGEFIEVVENSDLVRPMTEYLIRAGIARCVEWAAPLSVAVNIAPKVLETDQLFPVVADALNFYGLEASRLILEITERGELPVQSLAQLETLRELGVKISIDDFGTGQCSLSYFRDLPADQVKIDSSFVMAMNTSHKDRSIVRGCIDLAHHCNMEVVAEGVEDEQAALDLKEMGCDVLQGYWIGKPMSFTAFEQEYLRGLSGQEEPSLFASLLD